MNRSPSISEDFSTRFVEFIDEGRNIMTKALLITALITIILWCVPKTSVAGCALTTTLLIGTIILGAFYRFLKKKHDKEAYDAAKRLSTSLNQALNLDSSNKTKDETLYGGCDVPAMMREANEVVVITDMTDEQLIRQAKKDAKAEYQKQLSKQDSFN